MKSFSNIRFKKNTARRFQQFSKQFFKTHTETLEAMLDFFLFNAISPKETLGPSMRTLEESVKGRINALIAIVKDIEKSQTKPTTAMLQLLFEHTPPKTKQPELTAVPPLEVPLSEDSFASSFEAIEIRKEKNELKLELQQCRNQFLAFLSGIEIAKSSFGKPKLIIPMAPKELEHLKQKLKNKTDVY